MPPDCCEDRPYIPHCTKRATKLNNKTINEIELESISKLPIGCATRQCNRTDFTINLTVASNLPNKMKTIYTTEYLNMIFVGVMLVTKNKGMTLKLEYVMH